MSTDVPVQNPVQTDPGASFVAWDRVEKFVGQLSHDLRNGLNACELQLTFLAEISSDPDAAEEVKGLRSTLTGITKQLQAVRVATAPVKAHTLDYPAADLFEDLRERFARLYPAVAGRVEWKGEVGSEVAVNVDPDLTLTALIELLHNAMHFADADTPVLCALREKGRQVFCTVAETLENAPSPPEDWGKAPLESTRRGAYGLGLFRTRRGLMAQGSELGFQYFRDQKTLVATVTLPNAGQSTTR